MGRGKMPEVGRGWMHKATPARSQGMHRNPGH